MIGADVQDRRGLEVERGRGVELEAGELEDVEFSRRTHAQQVKRRLSKITSHANTQPCALRHAPNQRRDGALAVGARDSDNRRIGCASEQLDVSYDLNPATASLNEERLRQRHPGRCDDAIRAIEQADIQAPNAKRHRRIQRSQTS